MKITLDLTDVEIETLITSLKPVHRCLMLKGDRYVIRMEAVGKNPD